MPTSTLRIIIVIALMAHGIGHGMGLLAAAGVKLSRSHSLYSWLFTNFLGDTFTRITGSVVWFLALIAFVGAGLGLAGWLVPQEWWQPLAIAASLISLLGLVVFWNAFPFFFPNKVGVIVVDAALLISLLWLHWPPGIVSK